MHVGLQLVREGAADAFVSAGNTGAILAVATLRQIGLGRIPGVLRPALGVVFPIESKPMLIDNGANAAATCSGLAVMPWPNEMFAAWMSDHFFQWAKRPAVAPGNSMAGRSPKWKRRTQL